MYNELAPTYEELKKRSELAGELISERIWEGMHNVNVKTDDGLKKLWLENVRKNLDSSYFDKYMWANELTGLGINKAIIGVGAGPSFKKNEDVLKEISDLCVMQKLDDQPFIIIASNHMYKPLLEKGIYPHFVMLIDGGDAVYEHLCVDVPRDDKTILVAPLQIHPKVLKKWMKQGRSAVICNSFDKEKQKMYQEHTGKDPDAIGLEFGGNVLNCMWSLAVRYLKSSVFISVGNDLCFPRLEYLDDRRKGYYATGDYDINIKNRRDEARSTFGWMGFELKKSAIVDGHYVDFKPVNMSHTLFTYKVWLESQVIMNSESGVSFHYYNCSEGGALGVMSKGSTKEEMAEKDNWYLLDWHPIVGKRYHTRTLESTSWQFLQAREALTKKKLEGILTDAKYAAV